MVRAAGESAHIRQLGHPGDLGWVVMTHGELYDEEFGWNQDFEALVARIVADFANNRDPARVQAWIAEMDGRRVGCAFCVAHDEATAKLRILLVKPPRTRAGFGSPTGGRLRRVRQSRRLPAHHTLDKRHPCVSTPHLPGLRVRPGRSRTPQEFRPRARRAALGARSVSVSTGRHVRRSRSRRSPTSPDPPPAGPLGRGTASRTRSPAGSSRRSE